MAQQFCTSCGTRIDGEDQRFCVHCGAALDAGDATVAAAASAAETKGPVDYDLSGFGQMSYTEDVYSQPDYATATSSTDPTASFSRDAWQQSGSAQYPGQGNAWQQAGTQPYPQPAPAPAGGSGASRIVIIVSAAIVAIVAIMFIVMNMGQCSGSPVPQPSSSTEVVIEDMDDAGDTDDLDGLDDADDADDADDVDDDAVSDEDIYRVLNDAYDRMGSQADRIKDTAATLNNTIFVSDSSKRNAAASDAYALEAEVLDLRETLSDLDVPFDSRYYSDQQTLLELQEDLYMRIDVMCQAWDISLQYSNPKDHEAAIKKPLGKDNDSSGLNIYKKDFENRYPNARPQR